MQKQYIFVPLLMLSFLFLGCDKESPTPEKSNSPKAFKPKIQKEHVLRVTSSAYTSCRRETDSTPFLAAWNNRLKPGIKSIAVSRDLLKMGLKNGSIVTIDGLKGNYKVLDKMHKRWKKKIDIYMGCDAKRARRWGKRRVTIRWAKSPL
ncbi:MAG: hypothetical protein DRG09_00570 [Epsilonproteobacteria bacterium]|nr:MAG: hypothetical protein DRG09_00570 [Campylobacterota bacterium]